MIVGTPVTYVGGFAGTHTFGYACSGTNRLLLVGIGSGASSDVITGVTYNGVAMTRAVGLSPGGPSAYWYYLVAPPTGNNDVVVTLSSAGGINVVAVQLTDAPQTGVVAATGGNGNGFASSPYAVSISGSGALCFSIVHVAGDTGDLTPSGTSLAEFNGNGARCEVAVESNAASMSTSWTGGGIKNIIQAIVAITAPVPPDTTPPDITSTGTGSTNGPFAVNVAENAAGAFITLNANENVTWGALGGAAAAAFEKLNETATSVQIRPITPFNFDSGLGTNPKVFTVPATDGAGNARTVTINATVTDVNEAPIFSGTISIPTLTQGVPMTPIALAPFWTDPEGNSLTYALAGAAWPAGLSIVSGQLQGTPSVNGSFASRSITASDGTNAAVPSNTFTITINAGGDTTIPTLTGSVTVSALTQTGYTLTWPAGADNVAVASYERSLDGGATWSDVGNVLTVNITGRTPGATDQVRIRAKDAAGNVSTPPLAASVTLLQYSMTIGPFGVAGVQQNNVLVHYSLSMGRGPGEMSVVKQGTVTTDGTTGLATITHTAPGQAMVCYSPVAGTTFDINKHTCVRYDTLA